jgi:mannose-6-phosphate isomerase-like protein (cupin superfamily)
MLSEEDIKERFIPFDSLRYTTEAFIDYCIPECSPKYNYALIGPGVSQNPKQPVSLREKHGFQVGGISMPHGKTNPAHMHFTAEVFICFKGDWQMQWGFNPGVHTADVGEGDVLTVPPWIYRGFKNIGVDDGFMFTGLGRDSTGGILWGPSTLQAASAQGVHLTEDYQIIDERAGQKWDGTQKALAPMTPEEIAALRVWSPAQMSQRIVRFAELDWSADALLDASLPGCGAQLAPVLGLGMSEARDHQAPVANSHGFSIEWLRLPAGGSVSRHRLQEKQVLITYRGQVQIRVEKENVGPDSLPRDAVSLQASGSPQGWDSYAMPADCWRSLHNAGDTEALVLLMTAGDARKHITWATDVIRAAGDCDKAMDANGYVGAKHFIDRAQP